IWPSMMRARRSSASLRSPTCDASVGSSTAACGKATTLSWSMAYSLTRVCLFLRSTPDAVAAARRREPDPGRRPDALTRAMARRGAGLVGLRRRAVDEQRDLVQAPVEAVELVLGHRDRECAARVGDGELPAGAGQHGEHRRLFQAGLLDRAARLPGGEAQRTRLLPR